MEKNQETAEKRQRKVEKRKRLQQQINGNAPYRIQLIENIIKGFFQTKSLDQHEETIVMLLNKKENYQKCEYAYDRLLITIQMSSSDLLHNKAEAFQKKIGKK